MSFGHGQFIEVGERGRMTVAECRNLFKVDPVDATRKAVEAIRQGELGFKTIRNLPALQAAMDGFSAPVIENTGLSSRSVLSSAFNILMSNMVVSGINAAYDSVPTIGQDLVTDMDDPSATTIIAAVHSLDNGQKVHVEGQDFPEMSVTDEWIEIRDRETGRQLAISQKTIDQNQVANIQSQIDQLGKTMNAIIEEWTLTMVFDQFGSASSASAPYAYRPKGTGTTLYSRTANTPGTRAPSGTLIISNALTDYTDLDAAFNRLGTYLDDRGKRLNIDRSRLQLVVPQTLEGLAYRLTNSEFMPEMSTTLTNSVNHWGPRGNRKVKIISSTKIDDISTTDWFCGDFPSQFKRVFKYRMEYVTASGNDAYVRRREGFRARASVNFNVGATDYTKVVRSISTT